MTFCLDFLGLTKKRSKGNEDRNAASSTTPLSSSKSKRKKLTPSSDPPTSPSSIQSEPGRVFGHPLSTVPKSPRTGVPYVVEFCVEYIEQCIRQQQQQQIFNDVSSNSTSNSTETSVGSARNIYRIPGSKSTIDALKKWFEQQQQKQDEENMDDLSRRAYSSSLIAITDDGTLNDHSGNRVNAIASLLKNYIASLPIALIPSTPASKCIAELQQASQKSNQQLITDSKLLTVTCKRELDTSHYVCLVYLMRHLAWIAQQPNAMTIESLATVWGPSLFQSQTPADVVNHIRMTELLIKLSSSTSSATSSPATSTAAIPKRAATQLVQNNTLRNNQGASQEVLPTTAASTPNENNNHRQVRSHRTMDAAELRRHRQQQKSNEVTYIKGQLVAEPPHPSVKFAARKNDQIAKADEGDYDDDTTYNFKQNDYGSTSAIVTYEKLSKQAPSRQSKQSIAFGSGVLVSKNYHHVLSNTQSDNVEAIRRESGYYDNWPQIVDRSASQLNSRSASFRSQFNYYHNNTNNGSVRSKLAPSPLAVEPTRHHYQSHNQPMTIKLLSSTSSTPTYHHHHQPQASVRLRIDGTPNNQNYYQVEDRQAANKSPVLVSAAAGVVRSKSASLSGELQNQPPRSQSSRSTFQISTQQNVPYTYYNQQSGYDHAPRQYYETTEQQQLLSSSSNSSAAPSRVIYYGRTSPAQNLQQQKSTRFLRVIVK